MRVRLIAGLIVIAVLGGGSVASAKDLYLLVSANEKSISVVDVGGFTKNANGFRVWTHRLHPLDRPIKAGTLEIDEFRAFQEFNCERNEVRLLKLISVRRSAIANGGSYNPNAAWEPVTPQTETRDTLDALCGRRSDVTPTLYNSLEEARDAFVRLVIDAPKR